MVPITQLPSIFTLGVLLLFANHAFADGVMFTCTGTKGYAVSVGGRSFSNKPVASAKGWVPLNDGSDTIKLSIRNKEWDISIYNRSGNKFISYSDMGCTVMMNQQPIATSDMLFTVTCPYASTTYLFLDQEKGTKLIATDLSAPRPTTDGTANFAIAQLYTSDCRQGE